MSDSPSMVYAEYVSSHCCLKACDILWKIPRFYKKLFYWNKGFFLYEASCKLGFNLYLLLE